MQRIPRRSSVFALALLACVALLQGCSETGQASPSSSAPAPTITAAPQANVQPAMPVRFVYMSPPIPTADVAQPLFGDRDGEKIGQLLDWLHQAAPIDGEGLSSPIKGRSWAVEIEAEDGETREVRPAWRCESEKDEQGNEGVSCVPVPGDIVVMDPDGKTYFAESEPLYRFVSETYKDWMPMVKPVVAPETIELGETFRFEGHGWMTDRVVVEIAKDGLVVWRADAPATHGDFAADGLMYRWAVEPGRYDVTVKGVHSDPGATSAHEGSRGFSITVS